MANSASSFSKRMRPPRGAGKYTDPMSRLRLTFACWDYDRTRALVDGSVQPEGIDLTYLSLPVEETFFRRRRRGTRARREAQAEPPAQHQGEAHRPDANPRPNDRGGRDRCAGHRARAFELPQAARGGEAPVSRLRRRRARLLPAHENLPDH